ncbi:MAG: thiamine-phosphate kinase [Actinomycetota bacterium]
MVAEFALIERLGRWLAGAGGGVEVGHGDDAAVLALDGQAVLAIDALVEGRHWDPAISSPHDVGWKAVAVNVSDVAAMGARPVAAVVALHEPAPVALAEVEACYAGMAEAAARWGVALVGGDTVESSCRAVDLAILGQVAPGAAVTRGGAAPGQRLVCVGALGAAAAGLALARAGLAPLAAGDRAAAPAAGPAPPQASALLAAHRRPQALPAAGAALAAHGATAMLDVSDGLGVDLARLCAASGVSARLDAGDLPIAEGVTAAARALGVDALDLACRGGEDLALLAALPAERADAAVAAATAAEAGVPAAVIGRLGGRDPQTPVRLVVDGVARDLGAAGYEHFAPD